MENYNNISCDTGQDKTDWHSVWWITISVQTLDNIKMMEISMENYKIISDTGKGNNEWQTVWRTTIISVVTLDKVKLNDIQYSGLQYQF